MQMLNSLSLSAVELVYAVNAWAQDVLEVVSMMAWHPAPRTVLVSGDTQRATKGAVASLVALFIPKVLDTLAPGATQAFIPAFLPSRRTNHDHSLD